MKQRTIASTVVAVLSLTGCNSLNTSTTIYISSERSVVVDASSVAAPALAASAAASTSLVGPKKIDGTVQLCPVFRAPVMPRMPELPVKEIAAVGPGNPAKVEEIERKHIEDLRIYIANTQALMARARAQYQLECKPYLKK